MKRKMAVILTLTLLLCGCSHKTEVRDKGFVRIIGSNSDQTQSVALRLYGQDEILTGNGKTMFSAIENAEAVQGKTLFTGHLELIVLTPEETQDKLSILMQNNRISPSCMFLMVKDNATLTIEQYEEEELTDLIDSSSRKGKIIKKTICDVLDDLFENDGMAAVPIMEDQRLSMAVISENSIETILSEEETEGLCWLTSSMNDIFIPIDINGKSLNFNVRKSQSKLIAEKSGDDIIVTTEIKINGSCIEKNVSKEDVSQALAEKISTLCSKTISKTVTAMNADVIGIEKALSSQNIKYSQN